LPCAVLPLQVKGPFLKSRRQEPLPNQFKVNPTADDEKCQIFTILVIRQLSMSTLLVCRMLISLLSVEISIPHDNRLLFFTFQVNCCYKRSSKLGFTKTIQCNTSESHHRTQIMTLISSSVSFGTKLTRIVSC